MEIIPVLASLASSVSRAGINVLDRRQFRSANNSSALIGYWNNFPPIILMTPTVFYFVAFEILIDFLLSPLVILVSFLIQLVAHAFLYAYKFLRVVDVAIISKVADFTIPLCLIFLGYLAAYSNLTVILMLILVIVLPLSLRSHFEANLSILFLIGALTLQGMIFFGLSYKDLIQTNPVSLIAFAYISLVYRFVLSLFFILLRKKFSDLFCYPHHSISMPTYWLRGLLTTITQLSFIVAINTKNLTLIWPILNSTAFIGAICSYFFLDEKLSKYDLLLLLTVFVLTTSITLILNYA